MIDPHISASMFCSQVSDKKEHEYIVVHIPSGLTGKTQTKKLASRLPEITQFVKTILAQKAHLQPTDIKDLTNTFSKIIEQQTPWYHKFLAFISKSYRLQVLETKNVLASLSTDLTEVQTHQSQGATATICQHVKNHLEPYLSGKITKENDNKNRLPLVCQLEAIVREKHPLASLNTKRIEQIAFEEYLKEALKAYTNQLGRPMHPDAPEWQEHRRIFIKALIPAIEIDFTPGFIAYQKIPEALNKALWDEFRRANLGR